MALFSFLKGNQMQDPPGRDRQVDRGILMSENASKVIQAKNLLKKNEWEIWVMGPPPEIRQECDLVIEFPLIEEV